jgi:hypothetical protein
MTLVWLVADFGFGETEFGQYVLRDRTARHATPLSAADNSIDDF